MCNHVHAVKRSPITRANQRLLTKQELSPLEEQILGNFVRDFADVLTDPQRDLVARIRRGDVDVSQLDSVITDVETTFRSHETEITTVYRGYHEESLVAGRTLAAQRYNLSGSFDQVPERLVSELDDWALESTDEVIDSMSDEVGRALRRGAEDGMSIEEIAQMTNDDVFDGRLKESKAESVARTELNSASNTGAHSAYQDAGGVVAEEWLAAVQPGRTRDAHLEANGQVAPVDGTFLVGGEEMDHPGDKSASIGLWANCRCSVAPVMADQLTPDQLQTIEEGGRLMAGV